jgi:hypothetical protein
MTKLNVVDGGRDQNGANPWKGAFMEIEPHIHDLRRMIELVQMVREDEKTFMDRREASEMLRFCIHETRDKAEALRRKWTEL